MSHPIRPEDLLRRARQIITPPEKWYKGYFSDGLMDSPDTAYCALGAIMVARMDLGLGKDDAREVAAIFRLEAALEPQWRGGLKVASFNDADSTSHEDVLRLFDRAVGGK